MKIKSKFIVILLIVSIILGTFETYYVFATSKKELNNQSSNLDDKISETKKEIKEVENNLSDALKEVQTLVSQISTYEQAISELNGKIEDVSQQITKAENDIAQKQKETEEKQDLLNKRLIAIYENGNTSYLDMLLTSSDLSDFLSKYYLISEIAECDTNLITSLKNAKAELENAKAELEANKQSLETTKQEQVQKQEALKKVRAEKEAKVASLNSTEKALENDLEEFEADKSRIQAELVRIAKEEEEAARKKALAANSSGKITSVANTSPSSHGYIFPVAGLSRANINNKSYPSYPTHTGIDINIGVSGKSVVAVKSGTVVISEARIRNGKYYSYGEYVTINHHDGTMTLYAHMLEGSRRVSVGQEVSQGQVIGTVGSTGNSTGTHLHFEVRVGGIPVNPMGYLP